MLKTADFLILKLLSINYHAKYFLIFQNLFNDANIYLFEDTI